MHPPKNNRVKRIVNGGEADYGEWPWYVQLQKKRKSRLPLPIGILKHMSAFTLNIKVILKWIGRREGGQQLSPSLYH